ncbi:RlpA-like domain superfamily protein [Pleurotus pulmonarius]
MFSACRFALATIFSLSVVFPRWAVAANQGQATWYHTGQGACGARSNDEDHVVALSSEEFSRSNHCFKHIVIHHQGREVDATIVDRCEGCSRFALDLSPGAFKMLASLDEGTAEVTWEYI